MLIRIAIAFFALTAGLLLWHTWHSIPGLPAEVATHFDGGGRADGWSDRASFARTAWLTNGLVIVLFAGLALVVPRTPTRFISLPHREHWLAPARARATREELAAWLLGYGGTMNLFLLVMQQQMVRVNLGLAEGPEHLWTLTVAFLVVSLGMTLALVLRYARKP